MQLRAGRLTKAHGLKGGIKLELYTDEPEVRFVPGAVFSLQVPETSPWFGRHLTLKELRWYNGHPVGFFVELPDRTAVETALKAILTFEHDEADSPTEPDSWYDYQIVGIDVYRDGVKIGVVDHLEHLPAQDLLAIDVGGRQVLLPFVKAFTAAVDLAARRIDITPPPGLFEEAPEPIAE